MSGAVDGHQPGVIDAGIDLRLRQAGMAQQLLNGAQIAPRPQKVGCKGVAQRVRRRRVGQAERPAKASHVPLQDGRLQRTAACTPEQGRAGRKIVGAEVAVRIDRLEDDGQQRNHARLAALAGDPQCFAVARQVIRRQ